MHLRKSALMRELLPLLQIDLPAEGKLGVKSLFKMPIKSAWLEIGFGGGEHVAGLAALNPDIGFIGCEPFVNGVASLLDHLDNQKLNNVRIFPNDARLLLDALPDNAMERCFILYPDPWPKKRHIERRFVSHENLTRVARVLRPDGELQLATDVAPLAAWMHEQVSTHPSFKCIHNAAEPPTDWLATRYEEKGIAAGRKPAYMIYRRI